MKALHRRLFIGIEPHRNLQSAIQRYAKEWEWPLDARMTRFGRHHVTLHFLGDVGVGEERKLREALRKIEVQSLELELAVPELWRNGVAVLRVAPHDGLAQLHHAIGEAVAAAELKREAEFDFKPHVTLARRAGGARPPAVTQPIRWRVVEFQLVWSVLPPEATPARYEIVERFGLSSQQPLPPCTPSGQSGEQLRLLE